MPGTVVDGVAVKVVENVAGAGPEDTSMNPEPPAAAAGVAGSRSSTDPPSGVVRLAAPPTWNKQSGSLHAL